MSTYNRKTEKIVLFVLEIITAILAFIVFFFISDTVSKLIILIVGIVSLLKAIYNFKTINKTT